MQDAHAIDQAAFDAQKQALVRQVLILGHKIENSDDEQAAELRTIREDFKAAIRFISETQASGTA